MSTKPEEPSLFLGGSLSGDDIFIPLWEGGFNSWVV